MSYNCNDCANFEWVTEWIGTGFSCIMTPFCKKFGKSTTEIRARNHGTLFEDCVDKQTVTDDFLQMPVYLEN